MMFCVCADECYELEVTFAQRLITSSITMPDINHIDIAFADLTGQRFSG